MKSNRISLKKWAGMVFLLCVCLTGVGCSDVFLPVERDSSYMVKEAGEGSSAAEEADRTEEGSTVRETGRAEDTSAVAPQGADAGAGTAEGSGDIYVHVCGCVRAPGLYTFPSGIRAGEAITQAGGFTKKADPDAVNLATVLSDGMQLYVPSEEEAAPAGEDPAFAGTSAAADPDRSSQEAVVNINTAGEEELMTLSGIGEARAAAILAYREESGAFSSIEDIKNVTGIGDGIFERIRNRITV